MSDHYRTQVNADGLRVNSILFDVTTSLYTSTDSIVSSQNCMQLFGSDFTAESDQQYFSTLDEELNTFRKNTAAISSIHIYTNNPNIPNGNYISSLSDYSDEDWFLNTGKSYSTWTSLPNTDSFGNETYELSFIHRIGVISNEYSAYLVIHLDSNYLKNRIDQTDYEIMVSVDDSLVFYSTNRSFLQTQMPVPEDFDGSYYKYTGALLVNDRLTLSEILTFRPYKTDNLFFISVNDFSAYQNINHMTFLYIGILAAATLVPALVIFLFSSYFSRRVTTLKSAMHQARIGDYNIIDQFSGDDELSETFSDLKATVQMIHEKEALFYQSQLNEQQLINRQQQIEFEMLASQINPHFLYNTLETIRMQALSSGNRDVATSIKLLGKSMHYVLKNTGTSFTTLTKELDYIKTYLAIQKLRFGDRVNAELSIQEDLDTDSYKILPLLLQPIVENAIIHGLEAIDKNGHITIRIMQKAPYLMITISDNGSGMNTEELAALRENILTYNSDSNAERSIGLYNINQRIQLFYGEEYSMEIDSSPDSGTAVTLKLPQFFGN